MRNVKMLMGMFFCFMLVVEISPAASPASSGSEAEYVSEVDRLEKKIATATTFDDLDSIWLEIEAMKKTYKDFVYPYGLSAYSIDDFDSRYFNLRRYAFHEKQRELARQIVSSWYSLHTSDLKEDLIIKADDLLSIYKDKPYIQKKLGQELSYQWKISEYLDEHFATISGLRADRGWMYFDAYLRELKFSNDFKEAELVIEKIDACFGELNIPNIFSAIVEPKLVEYRKYVDDSKKEEEARLQAEERRVQAYNTYRSRMPELLEKVKQPAESFEQARAFLDEVTVFKTGDYYSLVTDYSGEFRPEYTSLRQGAEKHLAVFFDQKVMALKNKVDALVQGDSNFEQMIEECEQECVALQAQAPEIIDDYFNIHAKQKKHYKELRYALELKLRDVQRQVYANEMEEPIFNGREAWANAITRWVLGQSQYDEQFLRILNKALLGRSVVGRPHDAQVALIRKLRDQSSKFAEYINAWLLEQKKSLGWDELIQQLVQAKKDGKNERIKFLLALLDNSINLLDYPVLIKALLADDLAPYSEVLRHEQQQAGDAAAHKKKSIALKLSGAAAVAAGIGAGGYMFYKNRHKTPEQIAQLKWYKRYPMQLARKIEQAARFVSSGV